MSSNPRRPNLSSFSRTTSRQALGDAAVINATALPRSVSYAVAPDRPMDSNQNKYQQPFSPQQNDDPFVSISRAIQNAKIRAGARLRTMSSNKHYVRSSRYQFLYVTAKRLSGIFAIILLFLVFVFFRFSEPSSPSLGKASFWDNLRKGTPDDTTPLNSELKLSVAMQEALRHRPNSTATKNFDTGPWVIALIADLDKESCHSFKNGEMRRHPVPCSKANAWMSFFKRGVFYMPLDISSKGEYMSGDSSINWLDELELTGRGHFELEGKSSEHFGGRGMELSELEWFFGHLLTPDDHTGMLLEIMSPRGMLDSTTHEEFYGSPSKVPPSTFHRALLHDGAGDDPNAYFKSEWMVVKNDHLIIGGHGKAFTDPLDGSRIKSNSPKWIKVIKKDFQVSHINWTAQYDAIANAAGVPFPGYLMHEAVLWSHDRREWIFLPRRRSVNPFEPKENEMKGWNGVIVASENFENISTILIEGLQDSSGLRGFSSAKFVPGTNERLIAAIRTIEIDPVAPISVARATETFFSVFDLTSGKMIYEEEYASDKKYEGLVFL